MKLRQRLKQVNNNRGASLLIIIAVFALLIVLCTNMLMAARASTTGLVEETITDQATVYVSSVFQQINNELLDTSSRLYQARIFENRSEVKFTGFEGGPVTVKGYADYTADYVVAFEGKTYTVNAVYKSGSSLRLYYVKDIMAKE
ncbi:MAG: hypothetical protein MJ105_01940 [Lachnospiraceae bacterium]|nr:hypothetical protein [Lachnospiraceae bacterium]